MDRRRASAILFAATALLTACGGDDGGEDGGESVDPEDPGTTTAEAGAVSPDPGAPLPTGCPEDVPYDIEIRLDGEGARVTMTVVDSIALRRLDGRAWTVYLADFEMPDNTSWAFTTPEVPAGGTLVATGLDVFNAPDADALPVLEVGATGGLFGEVGEGETATFVNVPSDRPGTTSVDQTGESELLHLDDDRICLRTEITGESGLEFVGTLGADDIVDI